MRISELNQRFAVRSTPIYALMLVLALAGCKRPGASDDDKNPDGSPKTETKVPVEVAMVKRESMTASFQGTASLEAEAVAQVVSKASGVVLSIQVEEGTAVARGQLLARLENQRQRLQVAQASANLRKLKNELKRQSELFQRKLIGSDAFERVKFDVDTQQASYDLAALELSYTDIRAPIGGTVSQRLIKLGNQVNVGQSLFRIDDFDPLEARVAVPERDMQAIQAGQPVQMLVDAMPGKVFIGSVGRVSPVVDPKTGTFDVIAQFADASQSLRSGMFGRINIVTKVHQDVLVVPRVALLGEDASAAVYVVNADQKVTRKPVKVGLAADGKAEILEGLTDGERVIVLGQNAVREGNAVTVIGPAAAKPAEAAAAAVATAR